MFSCSKPIEQAEKEEPGSTDETTSAKLEISVENITDTGCDVYITNNSVRLYGWGLVTKSQWDTSGGNALWEEQVSVYKDLGRLDKFLKTSSDSKKFNNSLKADTQYIVYASYSDSDGVRKGDFYTEEFITNEEANKTVLEELYISNLALEIGAKSQLVATGVYSGYNYYEPIENSLVEWNSYDTSIAKVDQNGMVTAVGVGETLITVTAINGTAIDTSLVIVVDDFDNPVDLGLSVKWAQCNVGAETPEKVGDIFKWGGTSPLGGSSWSWEGVPFNGDRNYSFSQSYWESVRYATIDDDNNLLRTNDTAFQLWGDNWRMPTKDELTELFENCQQERTAINGESGVLLTGKKDGYTDKRIFLSDCHAKEYDDVTPLYWSATIRYSGAKIYQGAYGILVNYNTTNEVDTYSRNDVGSVRPVYTDEAYLDIAVSNIATPSCDIVISTNSTGPYFWVLLPKSYVDKYGAERLCNALISNSKNAGTLSESLYSGEQAFKYVDLDAQTEYVILAVLCDSDGKTTGSVHRKTFITGE